MMTLTGDALLHLIVVSVYTKPSPEGIHDLEVEASGNRQDGT
jgi:hypothetical protein